ncbi:ABC transporter ATP-binding protein [Brevundimonas sp. VNH65]|uniref:ABC transporter ATP-binding protein n=1 Tax=Brevundimonas sp. VNH65 TaxID=3400917 RepID=UPI003C0C01C4
MTLALDQKRVVAFRRDATEAPAARSRPTAVKVDGLGKIYEGGGRANAALANVSLSVARGEFVVLIGRSGSGKSTLLRLIAGLVKPTNGRVLVEAAAVVGPPPAARYVFQDFGESLFPWANALDNVAFGVRAAAAPEGPTREVAARYLELVGLSDAAARYPWEMSGGMQQRLAIARALASRPDILLMDEPFGAVDALSRGRLQDMLLEIWEALGLTVVLVTHDIDEAAYLADRVVVLDPAGQGVRAEVPIDLARPRAQLATREAPRFSALRRELHRLVLE